MQPLITEEVLLTSEEVCCPSVDNLDIWLCSKKIK